MTLPAPSWRVDLAAVERPRLERKEPSNVDYCAMIFGLAIGRLPSRVKRSRSWLRSGWTTRAERPRCSIGIYRVSCAWDLFRQNDGLNWFLKVSQRFLPYRGTYHRGALPKHSQGHFFLPLPPTESKGAK